MTSWRKVMFLPPAWSPLFLSEWISFCFFIVLFPVELMGKWCLMGLEEFDEKATELHAIPWQLRPLWNCSVATQEVSSEWYQFTLNWVCTFPVPRTRNVTNTVHPCCKPLLSPTSSREHTAIVHDCCPMVFHPLDGRSVNTDVATTVPSNAATKRCSTQLLVLQL